jgi:hypothetical protein
VPTRPPFALLVGSDDRRAAPTQMTPLSTRGAVTARKELRGPEPPTARRRPTAPETTHLPAVIHASTTGAEVKFKQISDMPPARSVSRRSGRSTRTISRT